MDENLVKEFAKLFSIGQFVKIGLVLLFAWGIGRGLKTLEKRLAQQFNRYRLQIARIFPFIRLFVWLLALGFILFRIIRPSESVALAVLASSGIAIGLAAQDLIRNAFSGMMMLFNPPYRVGDMVRVGGHYGEVIDLNLIVTRLKTFDDDTIFISNSEVFRQPVSNANAGELTEMVVVDLMLPATVDIAEVKKIARDSAVCSPYTYLKKPISIVVEDHFDHAFLTRFKIKAYLVDVRLERRLASDIIERAKTALLSRGILTA